MTQGFRVGWTPLHLAAEAGHLKIVMYITDHLEDKNPSTDNGHTPYSLAKQNRKYLVVNYLNKAIHKQNRIGDHPPAESILGL